MYANPLRARARTRRRATDQENAHTLQSLHVAPM
jgi:hypothetical protein